MRDRPQHAQSHYPFHGAHSRAAEKTKAKFPTENAWGMCRADAAGDDLISSQEKSSKNGTLEQKYYITTYGRIFMYKKMESVVCRVTRNKNILRFGTVLVVPTRFLL